jgi:predicted ribosomally synthesized peptide with SipW-like signal peptide
MTDESFEISRRKALAALGTVGVASAGAGLGTSAYFSDTETFENNSLAAGTLDMGVSYSAHYSDWMPNANGVPEDEGVPNVRMWDGPAGTTGGPGDLDPDEVGLPSNAAWLIAVSDDTDDGTPDTAVAQQFLENTEYQSFNDGTLDCIDGAANSQADDAERPVVDLDDVKPGDFGEVTFDFILCDNPGFVWLDGELRSASENGVTEPEADDPDEGPGVELLDVVRAAVWVDDGNNFQNDDETPLAVGSIADVLGMLGESTLGTALNGDIPAEEGGGAAGARNCFSASTEHSIVFAWWVPVDHGNEIQTDSATFDLGLYAEQCRHNDGSGMNDEPTGDPGGEPGGEPGNGVDGDGAISFLAACVSEDRFETEGLTSDSATITVDEVLDRDDAGDPTAVRWSTDIDIGALTVKYGSSTEPQGGKFTTYIFDRQSGADQRSGGVAVTGADEDGTIGDEDGSPETTSSKRNEPVPPRDSDQTESEPCPDGYLQVDKLEFDGLGL